MKGIVEERAVELAEYIVENKTTVRAAAKQFGVSKSTVHMDVARRLRTLNPGLYSEVREILDINKAQRHIWRLLCYVFIHNHSRRLLCRKGELKCQKRRKKEKERERKQH